MSLQAIDQFLCEQVAQGELDSHGTFTLDDSRSLAKLAKYQSERPGLWLIKALQAAVCAGAGEFRLRQGRASGLVDFVPREGLDAGQLVHGLLARPAPTAMVQHLQLALQALSVLADSSATLELKVNGTWLSWPLIKGGIPSHSPPPAGKVEQIRLVRRSRSLFRAILYAAIQTEENLLLQELGRFAPLAILIDNRLVNDPVINKPPGLRLGVYVPPMGVRPRPAIPYTYMERVVVTEKPLSDRMGLMDHSLRAPEWLTLPTGTQTQSGKHLFHQQWAPDQFGTCSWLNNPLLEGLQKDRPGFTHFDSRIERDDGLIEIWSDYNRQLKAISVRGYLSIDINRGRPGRLYLIKHGVLLKSKELPKALKECLILWSAPQLNTDLSQLQWLADEVWRETLREIADHLLEGARSFLRCAEEQLQTPRSVHIPGQQGIHFVIAKNAELSEAMRKAGRIVQWLESYPLHESLTD